MTSSGREKVSFEKIETPRPGVWVRLWEISSSVVVRFEVETSTGYRAILPACRRNQCALPPCLRVIDERHSHPGMSIDAWLRHIRTHCHNRHRKHAEKFLTDVCATYQS